MKPVGEGGGCLAEELCQRCNKVCVICFATLLISQRCKVGSHFKQKQNHGQSEKRNRPCFWDIADPFLRNESIDKSRGAPLHDFFEQVHFG